MDKRERLTQRSDLTEIDLDDQDVMFGTALAVLDDERFWLTPAYTLALQTLRLIGRSLPGADDSE